VEAAIEHVALLQAIDLMLVPVTIGQGSVNPSPAGSAG
jgi:hypothetical protein